MNLILVGMMGAGKSTVGRVLAETLRRPFVDTDRLIAAAAGESIPAIFAAEGEAGFRHRERAVIASLAGMERSVIATGGGAVLSAENRTAMRSAGVVVWLDAKPQVLFARASAQGGRPLLAGEDPLGQFVDLYAARQSAYQAVAHHRIHTDGHTVPEIATAIVLACGEL